MKETNIKSTYRDGTKLDQDLYPSIEEDDIYLLLYPVPTSPFPLPWHIVDAKVRGNRKGTWHKWMDDNLGFEPKKILAGYGLCVGERQILQGLVMAEDVEFGPDTEIDRIGRWKSHEQARLFLFGPDTIEGGIGDE